MRLSEQEQPKIDKSQQLVSGVSLTAHDDTSKCTQVSGIKDSQQPAPSDTSLTSEQPASSLTSQQLAPSRESPVSQQSAPSSNPPSAKHDKVSLCEEVTRMTEVEDSWQLVSLTEKGRDECMQVKGMASLTSRGQRKESKPAALHVASNVTSSVSRFFRSLASGVAEAYVAELSRVNSQRPAPSVPTLTSKMQDKDKESQVNRARIQDSQQPAASLMVARQEKTAPKQVAPSVSWYYHGDSGHMEPYQADQSAAIEAMYRAHVPQSLVINGTTYTFDFQHLYQINVRTKNKRRIQRGNATKQPITSTCVSAGTSDSCKVATPASSISTVTVDTVPAFVSTPPSYQWRWENGDGSFTPYETTTSSDITEAYRANPDGEVTIRVGTSTYTIDLLAMVQINNVTNYQRRVKCVLTASSAKLSEKAQWYYHGDSGHLEPYQDNQSTAIEAMYRAHDPQPLVINGNTYTFDFEHMFQMNTSTKSMRLIQRGSDTKHAVASSCIAASTPVSSEAATSASSASADTTPVSFPASTSYQWQWESDDGSFSQYDAITSSVLTEAYLANSSRPVVCFIGKTTYTVDLSAMVQTNTVSNHQRKVKCIPSPHSTSLTQSKLPTLLVGDVPPAPLTEINCLVNFSFLPAFNDLEVVSMIDKIGRDYNVEIFVLTRMLSKVSLGMFVEEIIEVFKVCASENILPSIEDFFPWLSVVQPSFEWSVYDVKGNPIPLPANINLALNLQYSLDGEASIDCEGKFAINFSSMTMTEEATGQCGHIGILKPMWNYINDSGFAPIDRTADWKTIEDTMLFGNSTPLVIGESNCAVHIDANTAILTDVASGQKCSLMRDPPASSAVVHEFLLHFEGASGATEAALQAVKQVLERQTSCQNVDVSSVDTVAQSLLYQHARQYCVNVSRSTPNTIQLHGTGQVYLDKVHLQLQQACLDEQKLLVAQASDAIHHQKVPQEWEPQNETVQVFALSRGLPEWSKVEEKMNRTMANQPIQIYRIQNKWLWQKYMHHKEMLHIKNGGQINELELFHGTCSNDPKNIYGGEEGFDMRFSAKGMWGEANYFAVNASYSDPYAYQASDGCLEMFLVKVLTGDSHECPPDSSLRKPPVKQGGATAVQLCQVNYDTVTGHTKGSRVYMTYDNTKAYPAYLIRYS